VIDFCVRTDKTRVILSAGSDVEISSSGRHSAANRPRVKVEPAEPASLERVFDLASRFEDFLSLFLGASIRLLTVEFNISDGRKGWLVRRQPGKIEKHDPQASFTCDFSQLAAAIAAWFSATEDVRPLQNFVYGTVRDSSMFVETEFLSLAQALESLHRLTDSTTLAVASTFKRICTSIIDTIRVVCPNSALARRLEESVQFANEPSFRNRIEALLARLNPEDARVLLGDPTQFEQTLRQTRNYLTHLGIHTQSRVLTSARDLFLFNQKLHALLRLLMLMNVGFPENVVFEAIRFQSQKWTLF